MGRKHLTGRRRLGLVFGVLVLAVALSASALADNTEADGDITTTAVFDDPLAYGSVCVGENTSASINVLIRRTGSGTNVFANSSSPTVSVLSATVNSGTATLSATVPAFPGNQISLPGNWSTVGNNTLSSPVLATAVLDATTSGTGTITFRSTGVNGSGGTITRDGTVAVSWTAVACDSTPPVITPSIAPAPNGSNGWHRSGDATVTFSVADAESAISSKSAACDATNVVSTDGTHSFTCTAASAGGSASETATVKRDVTLPAVALDPLPPSTAASSIGITGTASDATSGVDSVSVSGDAATFNAALGTFSRVGVPLACGPNAITAASTDKAGNGSATASASITRICDTTPPVITKTVGGTLGSNGWYTSEVTVTWSVTDPDSAVVIDSGCGTQMFSADTASATSSCAAHSVGGSSSDSVDLKIDKSAPVVSVLSAKRADASDYVAGTWSNADVTVTFACTDAGPSGVDSLTPNPVVKGEGENQTAQTTCTDNAGNSAEGSLADIDVDKTAPTITFTGQSPAKNGNGWNNADVTLSWTCADTLSGPTAAGDSETISSEGENQQDTGTCTDNAGNSATSTDGDVDLDKTDPGIAFTGQTPAANGNGWNNTDVTLGWACTDSLSGPAQATVSQTISSEGENQQATGTCTDNAGNNANSTDGDVNLDKSAPVVSVTGVTGGAVYILGSAPAAGCSTADTRSGVQTNAGVSVTGGSSNGVGTFTATCSGGADKAGNGHAPVSVSYTVEYTGLSGILQPINPDNTSLFNRGKAVPVKFRLAGDEPNGFDFSGWKVGRQQISCTSFGTIDSVQEPVVENPSNAYRYDAGADQYIYNASFGDRPAGTCWKVLVTLDSGQTLASAIFKLQK